jgi:hypothetical protein
MQAMSQAHDGEDGSAEVQRRICCIDSTGCLYVVCWPRSQALVHVAMHVAVDNRRLQHWRQLLWKASQYLALACMLILANSRYV